MRRRTAVLLAVLGLFAVASGVMAGLIQLYLSDLPQIRFLEDYRPSASSRIWGADGSLVGELFVERRKPVRLDQISPVFIDALLSVEDERFYDHVGVDVKAVLRALWADLRSTSFAQGGSTITQQLTRTLFLDSDKSVRRKVKEAILAVQIENHYSKNEILELYCNQIYLGGGAYGVEAASQKYFGSPSSDLTVPQAALLAGLPKAPSSYDPLKYPDRARRRRSVVLRRMLENRHLTAEEWEAAEAAPLGVVDSPPTAQRAPWFVEHVRQYLEEKYGYAAIYERGLEVRTTLDLRVQEAAEEALRAGLERLDREGGWRRPDSGSLGPPDEKLTRAALRPGFSFPAKVVEAGSRRLKLRAGQVEGTLQASGEVFPHLESFTRKIRAGDVLLVTPSGAPPYPDPVPLAIHQRPLIQGALVALDPRNGHIRAMVGGYDFAVSQFNRAVQARRQPGSGMKPFIYAAALEAGYSPADMVDDSPVRFPDPASGGWWEPQNYDGKFNGNTTLVEALTHSRNVVTVKLLSRLGLQPVIRLIRRFGVESPMGPNLSLALGTSEVTLLELTSAYGVLANAGIRCSPMAILSVADAQGTVLESHEPEYERAYDPDMAFVVMDMMRNVVNYGTGTEARRLGFAVAGKTGTTDDYQDAWFVGFSPDLAAGVWVGYDDNRPMGFGATGSRYAAPIWTDFMLGAEPGGPGAEFHKPEGVVFREIDASNGRLAGEECAERRPVAFIKGTEPRFGCLHSADPFPPSQH